MGINNDEKNKNNSEKNKEGISTQEKIKYLETEIQRLKNDNQVLHDKLDLQTDPNSKPRTIQRGIKQSTKFEKNNTRIHPTIQS